MAHIRKWEQKKTIGSQNNYIKKLETNFVFYSMHDRACGSEISATYSDS
jgi:hypothetical protein